MNDFKLLYYSSCNYSSISLFNDYIKLEDKINSTQKHYSEKDIVNIVSKYGKNLYEILKSCSFNEEMMLEKKKDIKEIFIEYYKEVGYAKNSSKDIIIDNYSIVFVHYDTIKNLTNNFIKFYLINLLYNMLDSFPENKLQLKKANEYMKVLKPDFEEIVFEHWDRLYNELIDIISNQFNYTLKIKFQLVKNTVITFNVISSDVFSLALYALYNTISLNSLHTRSFFICHLCHHQFAKTGNRQKYCSKCKEQINYSKNLDNNKLNIIKKIESFQKYYSYWDDNFKRKYDKIIALSKQSRKRLETNIGDLKKFYNEASKKSNFKS